MDFCGLQPHDLPCLLNRGRYDRLRPPQSSRVERGAPVRRSDGDADFFGHGADDLGLASAQREYVHARVPERPRVALPCIARPDDDGPQAQAWKTFSHSGWKRMTRL